MGIPDNISKSRTRWPHAPTSTSWPPPPEFSSSTTPAGTAHSSTGPGSRPSPLGRGVIAIGNTDLVFTGGTTVVPRTDNDASRGVQARQFGLSIDGYHLLAANETFDA